MSELEQELLIQVKCLKLPAPVQEYRFAAEAVGLGKGLRERLLNAGMKNWRFDFAWPDSMLAVECEGGAWVPGGGRHTRGKGFEGDLMKYHHAMRLGWDVYRCSGPLIRSGQAVNLIQDLLKRKSLAIVQEHHS